MTSGTMIWSSGWSRNKRGYTREMRHSGGRVTPESFHSNFLEAESHAKHRGTLTIPCGLFPQRHHLGALLRCEKGLTPGLDEAWEQARRQTELGIERERER